jgi:hypothetical protein
VGQRDPSVSFAVCTCLLPQGGDRAHVVEPVGELDEDHPQVAGHRDDHLAVVLDLACSRPRS